MFLFFNDKLVICIVTNAMHTMYILTCSISVKIKWRINKSQLQLQLREFHNLSTLGNYSIALLSYNWISAGNQQAYCIPSYLHAVQTYPFLTQHHYRSRDWNSNVIITRPLNFTWLYFLLKGTKYLT